MTAASSTTATTNNNITRNGDKKKKEENEIQTPSSNPSAEIQWSALFWSNALFMLCLGSSLFLLIGSICYPFHIGLFILLPYISSILLRRDELSDGRQWRWFSENFPAFKALRSHLDMTFSISPDLIQSEKEKNAQFILACFPHGCQSDFRMLMESALQNVVPNVAHRCRTLSASVLFVLPLVREVALWTGCIDARRRVAERVLDGGRTVIVLPGGQEEQLMTRFGEEVIYLKKRKGFVKLALRKGVPIVPVYVFGSNDMYRTSDWLYEQRRWVLKRFGITLSMCSGFRGSFCPLPVKTTIAFGKPIKFTVKGDEPTNEEVDKAHQEFCDAIVKLFDEHKQRCGFAGRTLKIV